MQRALAREEMFFALVSTMDEGFCVVEMLYDADGQPADYRFVEVNPAFEEQTGLRGALGKTIRQMVPEHDAHWFEIYGDVARTGESVRFESPADAMKRYYDVFAFRVGGEGSQRVGILSRDVTARKQAEAELSRIALYDKLTGLPNRVMFHDYFAKALARAERGNHRVALLFLDLNGFKSVNDTLGHLAGDHLLRSVAARLSSCVREGDLVSRLGGDEFTIVLEDCQANPPLTYAEKIIRVIEAPFDLGGQTAQISASIGIALYPDSAMNQDTLIHLADTAMYAAKKNRRHGHRIGHSSAAYAGGVPLS
jgi:diguanylate cyclase (GGDEF)-like protein/PAS domain S-box-containing protein